MPRTTLDLDAVVLARLREKAAEEGRSMGAVASAALAAGLHEPCAAQSFRLQPLNTGRLLIDLEDKQVLWDTLDGRR